MNRQYNPTDQGNLILLTVKAFEINIDKHQFYENRLKKYGFEKFLPNLVTIPKKKILAFLNMKRCIKA